MSQYEGLAIGGPWHMKLIARHKTRFELRFTPMQKPGMTQEPTRTLGHYVWVINHWEWEDKR